MQTLSNSKPGKKKINPEIKRQKNQERLEKERIRQRKTMRNLIIGTVAVIAVVVLLIVFIPNNNNTAGTSSSAPATFDYAQLPFKGKTDAPVKIVEFGDFKCPICKQYNEQIVPQIEKDYINTGTAALYFSNFPFIGEDSKTAALAVESVYHQKNEAFWPYLDSIYANQKDENTEWATTDYLVQLAEKANLGIDTVKLREDIENKTYAKQVEAQYDKGEALQIPGTPSIFINGVQYTGDLGDYKALKQAIEQAKTAAGSEG